MNFDYVKYEELFCLNFGQQFTFLRFSTSLKWHKRNVHQAGGFCYWLNTPPAGMVRLRPVRLRSVRLRPVRLRVRPVCQHFQPREKLSAAPRPHPHHKRIGADIQTETT